MIGLRQHISIVVEAYDCLQLSSLFQDGKFKWQYCEVDPICQHSGAGTTKWQMPGTKKASNLKESCVRMDPL